jgi:hypothetical protein
LLHRVSGIFKNDLDYEEVIFVTNKKYFNAAKVFGLNTFTNTTVFKIRKQLSLFSKDEKIKILL